MQGRSPLRCELCHNMTNGYDCHNHIVCAFCMAKYVNVPSHIPIGLWGKYVKIQKKKNKAKKMSLL